MSDRRGAIDLVESALLFFVLFFPSYLGHQRPFDRSQMYLISYNISYLVWAVPQALLLLLVAMRNSSGKEYGIGRLRPSDAVLALLTALGLCSIAIPVLLLRRGEYAQLALSEPRLGFVSIVLIGMSAIATGYREELFFRSNLYTRLKRQHVSALPSAVAASALFAVGHFYQGASAVAAGFVMGLFLALVFERTGKIHVVALGHASYNSFMLLTRW